MGPEVLRQLRISAALLYWWDNWTSIDSQCIFLTTCPTDDHAAMKRPMWLTLRIMEGGATLGSSLAVSLVVALAVIDGDTVAAGGERIRIANIDAPEIYRARCDAERRLALVAKHRLAELLATGPVEIHRGDPGTGRMRDRHGRTLATLSIDGRDVGEIMIAEGIARPWEGRRRPWCE